MRIRLRDTDYEAAVRQGTAAMVVESSFSPLAEDCPMISLFPEGDQVPVPDAEIGVFLSPFAKGS
ncbi:MAG: hypothetical protein GY713_10535 [Actinomycetia bacterium]|nr:hypothetical protein [Actinomycetes bacterium]